MSTAGNTYHTSNVNLKKGSAVIWVCLHHYHHHHTATPKKALERQQFLIIIRLQPMATNDTMIWTTHHSCQKSRIYRMRKFETRHRFNFTTLLMEHYWLHTSFAVWIYFIDVYNWQFSSKPRQDLYTHFHDVFNLGYIVL